MKNKSTYTIRNTSKGWAVFKNNFKRKSIYFDNKEEAEEVMSFLISR